MTVGHWAVGPWAVGHQGASRAGTRPGRGFEVWIRCGGKSGFTLRSVTGFLRR
jgi:hypothetical protein